MRQRLVGIETEFNIQAVTVSSGHCQSSRREWREMIPPVAEKYRLHGLKSYNKEWLTNGGAGCIDMRMLEMCTPEALPNTVGSYVLAAEIQAADAAEIALANLSDSKAYLPLRSRGSLITEETEGALTTDEGKRTLGHHENYSLEAKPSEYPKGFINALVCTAYSWTGGGRTIIDNYGCLLVPAQKNVNNGSHSNLFNFKTDDCNPRLELRAVEYPVQPFMLDYRYSFISGALRLAERGIPLEDVSISIADSQMATIMIDNGNNFKFVTADGQTRTAVEIQLAIAEKISALDDIPEYEREAACEVAELCHAIIDENWEYCRWRNSYYLKLELLQQLYTSGRLDPQNSGAVLAVETAFDNLLVGNGHSDTDNMALVAKIRRRAAARLGCRVLDNVNLALSNPPDFDGSPAKKRVETVNMMVAEGINPVDIILSWRDIRWREKRRKLVKEKTISMDTLALLNPKDFAEMRRIAKPVKKATF